MLTGHCLCGKVRYEISQTPVAMMYCHCEECRRATGSSLNTSIFVEREHFRILSGENAISSHETSAENLRHFCSSCGSPLFKYFPHPAGMMTIRAGTLDSDPGVRPSAHIWVDEKAPWFEIADGLPQFRQGGGTPPPDGASED